MTTSSQQAGRIHVACDETTVRITLDRPEAANALDADMVSAIVRTLAGNPQRTAVLAARGSAFCAGGDLKAPPPVQLFQECVHALAAHPGGVVAIVQGAAVGAGLHLALAADFVVASSGAHIAFPAARLRVVPPASLLRRMLVQLGSPLCKRLLVLGEKVGCAELQGCGWNVLDGASFQEEHEQRVAAILRELTPAATGLLKTIEEHA